MKKTIIGIIAGVLVGTISSVIASSYIASQIAYTPKDSTWKVDNVGAAIDSLQLSKTATNYSTEEKVVGTWIDGKPLYQKTIVFSLSSGSNDYKHGIKDVDMIFFVNGFRYLNNQTSPIPYIDVEAGSSIDSWSTIIYHLDNEFISYRTSPRYNNFTIYVTVQYTKTTDEATN